MREYLVVSFIQNQVPERFKKTEWPLHLTLLRPFSSTADPAELSALLALVATRHVPIASVGKSREFFGPNNDIAVTEMEKTDALFALHVDIKNTLALSIVEFIGPLFDEFRPHITEQQKGTVAVGEAVLLENISLLEKSGNEWQHRKTIQLAAL